MRIYNGSISNYFIYELIYTLYKSEGICNPLWMSILALNRNPVAFGELTTLEVVDEYQQIYMSQHLSTS